MQRLPTLLPTALAALFATGQLLAADPESAFGLAPSSAPSIAPATAPSSAPATAPATTPATPGEAPTDSPLIPEVAPATPALTKDQAKAAAYQGMNKTEVAEDKLKNRVEWRIATMKAERDPDLQAIKERALAAHTDYEQRKIFIEYYTKFFDLIAKIDPKLKKEEVDAKKSMYCNRYVQGRVAPTIDPAVARAARN